MARAGPATLPVLLAVATYATSIGAGFVWDDTTLVLADARLRSLEGVGEILASDFFAGADGERGYGYYRPVVTLTYMADLAVFGPRPAGFHVTNVALHALVCLVVYALGAALLRRRDAACVAACLFAVHAVHAESVVWISGRTDLLATLFSLLSWLAHARARDAAGSPVGLRVASLACFAVALCSKESAVVLPLLVLVDELRHGPPRRAGRAVLPLLAVLAGYVALRFGILHVAAGRPWAPSAGAYLATVPVTVARYLGELVWPFPLEAYQQNPYVTSPTVPALLSYAAVASLAAALHRLRRDRLAWLAAALLVSLLPLLHVVRVSSPLDMGFTMAERFLYLPSVPFCWAVGALVFRSPAHARPALAVVAGVGIAFAIGAAGRAADFRDEVRFFEAMVAQAPGAPLPRGRLGMALSRQGRHDEALAALDEAARLHRAAYDEPAAVIQHDAAVVLRRAGRPLEALRALRALPPDVASSHALGETLRALGRLDEAEPLLERALRARPRDFERLVSLARLRAAQGRHDEALSLYDRAHALYPDEPSVHLGAGDVHVRRGAPEAALSRYAAALDLDPGFAEAHAAVGAVHARQGRLAEARASLGRALALRSLPEAHVTLAIVEATEGDLPAARRRLERVLEVDPDHVDARYDLALVLARLGRSEEARRHAVEVLARAPRHAPAARLLERLPPPAVGEGDAP